MDKKNKISIIKQYLKYLQTGFFEPETHILILKSY